MSKVWGLLLGLAVGAAFGAVLVILFSPASGEKFRHQLQQGWNETLDEARQAAGQRRIELEAQFQRMKHGG